MTIQTGCTANQIAMPADAWKPRFLASLRMSGIVGVATKEAGVSRRTAYAHREKDTQFRADWDAALEDGVDDILLKRAFDLTDSDNPNYDAKVAFGMLKFLLRGYRPQGFRERPTQKVFVFKIGGHEEQIVNDDRFDNFSDDELRLASESEMVVEYREIDGP